MLETVHVKFSLEVEAMRGEASPKIDELARVLRMIREVAKGRPPIDFGAIIDTSNCTESANKINQLVAKQQLPANAISIIAKHISTPLHIEIVAKLDEKIRSKVRDEVLQAVLKGLTSSGSEPMPTCAAMMAEMVRLELVLLRGVATTLETLLSDKNTRRAAIAVLGKLSEQHGQNEAFVKATAHLQQSLLKVQDQTCDYDVITICRNLGWRSNSRASLTQVRSFAATGGSPSPHRNIVSSAYFAGRDELATGGDEGIVAVWGPPSYGETPSATLQLPPQYVPVAMDASPKGNALAVAAVAGHYHPSTVKLYACADSTGTWSLGDTLTRPVNTIITCIRAVSSRIGVLCVAETTDESAHDIVFFGGSSATVETRKIAGAHSDYITVTASSTENENWLLTGSRDATARVWDTRSQAVSPAHTLTYHHDTVTSIASMRDVIVTASLDQTLCIWDMRKLKAPVAERGFSAPVLRVACTAGTTAVVATSNSLSLLSLHPLQVHDVIPNVCYTEVRANHDGTIVFASNTTLDTFLVQLTP